MTSFDPREREWGRMRPTAVTTVVASENSVHLLAVTDESEQDRRMIAIGLLFVRMLCDFFKPRPRLEAEILILRHQLNVLYAPDISW
jgi:hypothetical protein